MNIPESMKQITEIAKSLIDTFYWSPVCIGTTFIPYKQRWTNSLIEQDLLKEEWVFKSEEECKQLCEDLNRIIKKNKIHIGVAFMTLRCFNL